MPIKKENAKRYPPDWPKISLEVRERAGWRCEECGAKHNQLGGRNNGHFYPALPTGSGLRVTWPHPGDYGWCAGMDNPLRIIRIILTVAHLNHLPEDCGEPGNRPNLKALCQRCHLNHDRRQNLITSKKTRDLKAGQMALPID